MKRAFDITIALVVLIISSPLLIFVIIFIKLETSGPIFYQQIRLGYKGNTFKLLKFRSMTDKCRDLSIQTTGNEIDVTRVGKIIRRLKIDELPQLVNVIKGDMSIVGPRPCLPELRSAFNENGKIRLNARPGLTGLAQINGNIHLSWEERWMYDRQYAENHSLFLDTKIIAKTFFIIVFGEEWGLK